MTQNDPTNSALAAIASIFGPSRRDSAEDAAAPEGQAAAGEVEEAGAPQSEQGVTEENPVRAGDADQADEDKVDAVADQPVEGAATDEADGAAEGDSVQLASETTDGDQEIEPTSELTPSPAAAPAEPVSDEMIDGYSRSGPGPLDSLRFKWTARRDEDGAFYVDETIGFTSRPISTGPLPREQVIAFIDERARLAQERFDELRSEMIRPIAERQREEADAESDA